MSGLSRAITQKILVPCKFSSLSSSGGLKYTSKTQDNSKEDELLDDTIEKMWIGFEKIGLPIHGFTDHAFFITRIFLPSEIPVISGKRWIHASILVKTNKGYSICVEFGAYQGEDMIDKDKDTYKTYYWNTSLYGLRYAEMNYDIYKKYKLDYDSYSERIFPLQCGRNITLRTALSECNSSQKWIFKNYDLAKQNCQHFAAKFIEVTKAYRREGEAHRGLHNLSSAKIPKVILTAIEENEKDGWNTAGKVPVVGPIIGAFHGIFSKLKKK